MPVKQILVPVDFSDASRKAVEYAIFLAKNLSSKIIFLHGYSVAYIPFTRQDIKKMVRPASNKVHSNDEIGVRDLFDLIDQQPGLSNIEYENYLATGAVVDVICNTAATQKVDLIVMGNTGTMPVKDFFFGTHSEKVSRRS